MKSADIIPGRYYRVRLQKHGGIVETDRVRIERKGEPRYPGDIFVWEGIRHLAKGPIPTHHAARDILHEDPPDAKTLAIIKVIEEQS